MGNLESETKISTNSETEEKARACRDRGAAWAFEDHGLFYCFMAGVKPPCAEKESRVLTRKLYSAAIGWEETTERYYICGVKNGKKRR